MLCVGAGVGEETFFRGWMQTALIATCSQGGALGLTPDSATVAGLVATSLVFGALHALTPVYFIFATLAGFIFGVEFLNSGLLAASCTHAVYDFIALLTILQMWESPDKN